MTVEEATGRLLALIDENGGSVSAALVEADTELGQHREIAAAAAHALATEPNIRTSQESDGRAWFPYSVLIRSEP